MATEKRLIDVNAADVERISCYYGDHCYIEDVQEWLNEQPTVDAVEVAHGRWEWYTDRCEDLFLGCDEDYGWRCSHCQIPLEEFDDPEAPPTFNYCPNCGASMRDGDGNG